MQTVAPDTSDRKYFTLAPNIIFALCRDPYDLAAWLTVKLVAGDIGECILSTEEASQLSGMSEGKWIECRKHLMQIGALTGELRRDPGYPQPVWHLRIPDLWPANVKWRETTGDSLRNRLASILKARKGPHQVRALLENQQRTSPGEGQPSPGEGSAPENAKRPSPGEAKKKYVNAENQKEEEGNTDQPAKAPFEFPSLTASATSDNPWEKLKATMRLQLPRSTYETWLRDTVLLAATEDEYTIRVHDANTREWLSKRLQNKIALNLQSVAGRQITVKYVTAQEIPQ